MTSAFIRQEPLYKAGDFCLNAGVAGFFRIIKLFEGLSILLRGGLEGLPLILMEFLRVWFEGPV